MAVVPPPLSRWTGFTTVDAWLEFLDWFLPLVLAGAFLLEMSPKALLGRDVVGVEVLPVVLEALAEKRKFSFCGARTTGSGLEDSATFRSPPAIFPAGR